MHAAPWGLLFERLIHAAGDSTGGDQTLSSG
jgi:hypothetical protein